MYNESFSNRGNLYKPSYLLGDSHAKFRGLAFYKIEFQGKGWAALGPKPLQLGIY